MNLLCCRKETVLIIISLNVLFKAARIKKQLIMSGPLPWPSTHAQLRQRAACPLCGSRHFSLPLSTSIVSVLSHELSAVCPKPSRVVPRAEVSSPPGVVAAAAHGPTVFSPTRLGRPLEPLTHITRPLHLLVPLPLLTTSPQTYPPLSMDLLVQVIRAEIQRSTAAADTPGQPPPPSLPLPPPIQPSASLHPPSTTGDVSVCT